jgi:hypothetical protein
MILKASNLSLTDSQESARMIADVASGSATITVDNILGFSVDDYVLIGEFGNPSSEILKLHASTAPTGSTITLSSNTTKDHYSDSKVTVITFNRVEFSRATTLTGTKSVLTTKDVSPDREETTFIDTGYSTGFAFFRFSNPTSGFYSEYSSGVSYSGQGNAGIQEIIETACNDSLVKIGDDVATEEMLLKDANDCQDAITDFDWKFELVTDSALTVSQYENSYDLSGLTYDLKYPGIEQGIKGVKLAGKRLDYVDNDEMDSILASVIKTTVATQAGVGATSIVLSNTSELSDSGKVYINSMQITYTANDKATNTLSGISASDITAIIAVSSIVWQNINPGLPTKYTITIDNKIILNVPIDTEYDGYGLTVEYLKKLDRFTDFAAITEVPFTDLMPLFISAKIEKRKRNFDNYRENIKDFNEGLQQKLSVYRLPVLEDQKYYNFV